MNKARKALESLLTNHEFKADIRYDEPMSEHTTFKVGGPADVWVRPHGEDISAISSLIFSGCGGVPVFILGGGANIVVSDRGIRGIVLDTGGWKGCYAEGEYLVAKSGTKLDEAAECAAEAGLCGLEFLAGMPGTIGGAVYMNARCYGREITDVLVSTEIIDFSNGKPAPKKILTKEGGFGYKQSPFQGKKNFINTAKFKLQPKNKDDILSEMKKNRQDREQKGHYTFPSAGSIFKNNHIFGKPAGQIIDELGLLGLQIGGAQVAPFHGNIIVNSGKASASDIRALVEEVAARVKDKKGITLETEIIFAGEW